MVFQNRQSCDSSTLAYESVHCVKQPATITNDAEKISE